MPTERRNAIIMAAGTASRFVPLSAEIPKGLLVVKGEVLIERQIRQLMEAGIDDITVVVGYKAEMFEYLASKYGVQLVLNEDYNKYNNTSSLIRVLDRLGNTYICSSDNYFPGNVFLGNPEHSFYSARFAEGNTSEYCLYMDEADNITNVVVGGADCWYMIGHVYFAREFSERFKTILAREYAKEETKQGYWEDVYIRFINELPKMKIHRCGEDEIFEFDSIDELRTFDESYINNTRSSIIREIATQFGCSEAALAGFERIADSEHTLKFTFLKSGELFFYDGSVHSIIKQ